MDQIFEPTTHLLLGRSFARSLALVLPEKTVVVQEGEEEEKKK